MLTGFQETGDGRVYVRNAGQIYSDKRENFETDFGHKIPPIPKEATQRIYEPGKRHAFADGSSVLSGGDLPWPFGDAAIDACDKLLAAKAAREVPPPPTAEQLLAAVVSKGRELLCQSDLVAIRCQKVGIAYPKEWQAYDNNIRAIVRSPVMNPVWPAMPNKPSNI